LKKAGSAGAVIGWVFALIFLWFCYSALTADAHKPVLADTAKTIAPPDAKSVPECLETGPAKWASDGYISAIEGTIKNGCGRRLRMVEIEFKLFNKADQVVGTASAIQNGLDVGETWKFSATNLGEKGVYFHPERAEITAY
jgi:hypothetical protein